jgi:pyrroline-5-carboxylate reductase
MGGAILSGLLAPGVTVEGGIRVTNRTEAKAALVRAPGVESFALEQTPDANLTAAATAGISKLLAPSRPDLPNPVAMPDAQAQEEARKRSIIEQTARRGRASTVLTDSAGTLGG